jgi:hypothetical protein
VQLQVRQQLRHAIPPLAIHHRIHAQLSAVLQHKRLQRLVMPQFADMVMVATLPTKDLAIHQDFQAPTGAAVIRHKL